MITAIGFCCGGEFPENSPVFRRYSANCLEAAHEIQTCGCCRAGSVRGAFVLCARHRRGARAGSGESSSEAQPVGNRAGGPSGRQETLRAALCGVPWELRRRLAPRPGFARPTDPGGRGWRTVLDFDERRHWPRHARLVQAAGASALADYFLFAVVLTRST